MTTLTGKTAMVTGGSRGIGAAIARRLATEGADVAITYNSSATPAHKVVAAIEAMGRRAIAIQADTADTDAVKAAVDQAASTFGRLDILVNNAGVFDQGTIDQVTIEHFDRIFNVNVRGLVAATVAGARHMTDGGRIIQIGSVNADRIPFPGAAVYGASKAAVQALTKGFARDLGPKGITVNTVQPGPVDTEMNPDNSEFSTMLKSLMAIPRYAQAEDVAAMVAFLAGPETSMVTGSSFNVDGGFGA